MCTSSGDSSAWQRRCWKCTWPTSPPTRTRCIVCSSSLSSRGALNRQARSTSEPDGHWKPWENSRRTMCEHAMSVFSKRSLLALKHSFSRQTELLSGQEQHWEGSLVLLMHLVSLQRSYEEG